MGNFKIYDMNKDNVDGVYEVETLSFTDTWSKKAFVDELKNNLAYYKVIVDEETSKVVAFGGLWKVLDEAHITNIAVHPEYRGKKLGNMIVEALIEKAREIDIAEMTLEVRASNETAKNLYAKYGFKIAGIRKEYYQDNKEDAIIMWKSMKELG